MHRWATTLPSGGLGWETLSHPAAAEAIRRAIDPGSDIHATAAYRRHVAGVLALRAIRLAVGRAKDAARV